MYDQQALTTIANLYMMMMGLNEHEHIGLALRTHRSHGPTLTPGYLVVYRQSHSLLLLATTHKKKFYSSSSSSTP